MVESHSGGNTIEGRIEPLLKRIGFPFSRDGSGDYNIGVGIAGGRQQTVTIAGRAQPIEGGEILRISSNAYICDGHIAEGVANALLALNSSTRVGAWCIQLDREDVRHAAYVAKVSFTDNPELLRHVLLEVADMADDIEHKLSGADAF